MLTKDSMRLLSQRFLEELTVIFSAVMHKVIRPRSTHRGHYCIEANLKRCLDECAVIEAVD